MSERVEHSDAYWHGFGRALIWQALKDAVHIVHYGDVHDFIRGVDSGRKVWATEERHAWAGSPRPAHPVLDLPMGDNDANASTVREYLALLAEVAMDVKRPFGNSGWHYELFEPLVKAGLIHGTFAGDEEDGYWLDGCDTFAADRLIQGAILAMGGGQ